MKRFLNKWFTLDFESNGHYVRAKCVDIEFQTGYGPIFLMETRHGKTFWLTRKEIEKYEVTSRRQGV